MLLLTLKKRVLRNVVNRAVRLARGGIGALLDHEVSDLMHVVRPATYHR